MAVAASCQAQQSPCAERPPHRPPSDDRPDPPDPAVRYPGRMTVEPVEPSPDRPRSRARDDDWPRPAAAGRGEKVFADDSLPPYDPEDEDDEWWEEELQSREGSQPRVAGGARAGRASRVAGVGCIEYFQDGFWQGLALAIADPELAAEQGDQGYDQGYSDSEARASGASTGAEAAEEAAREDAEEQVRAQFRNLGRFPTFSPAINIPDLDPGRPWGADLLPSQVLTENRLDPQSTAQGQVPDDWLPDSSQVRRFLLAGALLGDRLEGVSRCDRSESVLDQGFAIGWDHGVVIRNEFDYYQDYLRGANQVFADTARAGFADAYPRLFRRSYERAFRNWSTQPHPEIIRVDISDRNDGVFEPGETLFLDCWIVNYGGAPADFWLGVEASVGVGGKALNLHLPARHETPEPARVALRLGNQVGRHTLAQVAVGFGPASYAVDVEIAPHLQITRRPEIHHIDVVKGSVRIGIKVGNRGRHRVAGLLHVAVGGGFPAPESPNKDSLVSAIQLQPQAEETLAIDLDGFAPSDLLRGGVELVFSVAARGVTHDSASLVFPDIATNLDRRDLVEYLVELAAMADAPAAEVGAARTLLLGRLCADWETTKWRAGNPYREDVQTAGSATALGDLVQTYFRQRARLINPKVFSGLSHELGLLANRLDGPYPYRRKFFKRLARNLP